MVLLTSSSISVAISSGVVFLFTFLLFLSGYVVQQQTVRSLQAALHPPPQPSSTLPVYFQHVRELEKSERANETENVAAGEAEKQSKAVQDSKKQGHEIVDQSNPDPVDEPHSEDPITIPTSPPEDPREAVRVSDGMAEKGIDEQNINNAEERSESTALPEEELAEKTRAQLAYVQVLSDPSQICSALLFFKLQMDQGDADLAHLLLYPSSWEEDTFSDPITSALALIRLVKDDYRINYHAVQIDDQDDEQAIARGLLAHLIKTDWTYDRMLYLRSPGLALNIEALDSALQISKTASSLSRLWGAVNLEASTNPSVLMISEHGAYTPRGSNRRLTTEAITTHANHHENEMDVEAASRAAAYVHFGEAELEHRRAEKEWYGGVFERYERARAEICRGVSFEGSRTELRRKVKRSR
jgi:hypothetical protein